MHTPSNLYSIQLRPCIQDGYTRVVNPVFNIERRNDATGTPLSALYNAIYALYPNAKIADPQAPPKTTGLETQPGAPKVDEHLALNQQPPRENHQITQRFTLTIGLLSGTTKAD